MSEPADLNYLQHTVLLQYLELVELRNWLNNRTTGKRGKKLTIGRVTFEDTSQNGMFITTTPDPTRAKPVFRQKEMEDGEE